MIQGWRAGEHTGLNSANNWDRVVFTANATDVPAPSSLAIIGLGLMGLAARRFKKQA